MQTCLYITSALLYSHILYISHQSTSTNGMFAYLNVVWGNERRSIGPVIVWQTAGWSKDCYAPHLANLMEQSVLHRETQVTHRKYFKEQTIGGLSTQLRNKHSEIKTTKEPYQNGVAGTKTTLLSFVAHKQPSMCNRNLYWSFQWIHTANR